MANLRFSVLVVLLAFCGCQDSGQVGGAPSRQTAVQREVPFVETQEMFWEPEAELINQVAVTTFGDWNSMNEKERDATAILISKFYKLNSSCSIFFDRMIEEIESKSKSENSDTKIIQSLGYPPSEKMVRCFIMDSVVRKNSGERVIRTPFKFD